MRTSMSFAGTAGLVCLLLQATPALAGEWSGSYSADGRCYCSGTLAPTLASRIVPTPRGGKSVAKVCELIGEGPGISVVDGRFDRVVYTDAQCGHGPFAAAAKPLGEDCAGTLEPDSDDCQPIGPRWDLTGAYQARDQSAVSAVADAVSTPGQVALPAAVPMMGAATGQSDDGNASDTTVRIVEIDGRRWREAPPGTSENGAPGSRIILDGKVFLDVDKTPASVFVQSAPTTKPRKNAVARQQRPSTVPDKPKVESAESIRERQKALLAAARERLKSQQAGKPSIGAAAPAVDDDKTGTSSNREADKAATDALAAESARAEALRSAEAEKAAAEKLAKQQAADKKAAAKAAKKQAKADKAAAEKLAKQQAADKKAAAKAAKKQAMADKAAADKLAKQQAADKKAAARAAEKQAKADKAAADKLAKQQAADEKAARKQAEADKLATENKRRESVDETVGTLSEGDDAVRSPFMQALRLPEAARPSSREFGYVDAMPISYDFGGAGVSLEGSAVVREKFQLVARLGAATDYRELLVGGSYFMTPSKADRMTVVMTAGLETGSFELSGDGVETELSDSGIYLGAASRFVVNRKFELQGGVGYSSFFEGDPILFGGGFYHVLPKLDVVSRFELGDNDSLGIGVRYYY